MSILGYIIIFTIIGSILSLVGGVILLAREKIALKVSHFLISFAAGALLGAAFFDLLPESLEEAEALGVKVNIFFWALLGILLFFILERFIHWFHHNQHQGEEVKPVVPMVVLGDSVHNFIDGAAIAAAFTVDINVGIITALAVAAHEVPQEIGNFAILLHQGLKKGRVLFLKLLSASTALLGAFLTYFLSESIEGIFPILLSTTAGFFIYIAVADIIPDIHHKNRKGFAFAESSLLILGIIVVWVGVKLLEG